MSFLQFLMILRAKYKVIVSIFLLTVILVLAYSLNAPKKYVASTSVLLNYKGTDPVTGVVLPAQLMIGYMQTQIDIIKSPSVAKKVVKSLNILENEKAVEQFQQATNGVGNIEEWYANLLLKNLEVIPSKESSLIHIVFEGTNANFVALVADAFAKAYIDTSIQLKIEPARQAAVFLGDQVAELRSRLEKAQSKLSRYQKEHGITNVDGSLDVEVSRMNELSTQLVLAQARLYETKSKKNNVSPDIDLNPLVGNLRLSLSSAEAKLADVSAIYGKNHPKYQAINAEVEKYRNQLNKAITKSKSTINQSDNIAQDRVEKIKQALKKQKEKVLDINSNVDELSVYKTEVANAQQALTVANNRYNQVSQDGSSKQSEATILNKASIPTAPNSPRILLNLILSLFMGAIIGVFTAVLLELPNKKVRSREDIYNVVDVPVFSISSKRSQVNEYGFSIKKLLLPN